MWLACLRATDTFPICRRWKGSWDSGRKWWVKRPLIPFIPCWSRDKGALELPGSASGREEGSVRSKEGRFLQIAWTDLLAKRNWEPFLYYTARLKRLRLSLQWPLGDLLNRSLWSNSWLLGAAFEFMELWFRTRPRNAKQKESSSKLVTLMIRLWWNGCCNCCCCGWLFWACSYSWICG